MGSFHEGHVSLIRKAAEECDVVVVSVFVNPTQFGIGEDLAKYPRNIDRDSCLAEEEGVDIFFAPSEEEMYPKGRQETWVRLGEIEEKLCGAFRPGHFRGVATVVAKLTNIVRPNKLYLGEKDFQQLRVVQRMVEDLDMGAEVIGCPTLREPDGLAMSSRNAYMSPEERAAAKVIYEALMEAKKVAQTGTHSADRVKQALVEKLVSEPLCRLQFVSVCDSESLEELTRLGGSVLIAIGAYFGTTRMVDSIVLSFS